MQRKLGALVILCVALGALHYASAIEVAEVDGVIVRASQLDSWAQERREAFLAQRITLDAGDVVLSASIEELGGSQALRDEGFELAAMLRLAPVHRRWVHSVDEVRARELLSDIRALTEQPPAITDGLAAPGRVLDLLAATALVSDAIREHRRYVVLPFRSVAIIDPPAQEQASATFGVNIRRHSSRYTYRGSQWGRARNIVLAARAIDGRVIAPGESFSFNDMVGPRTFSRGFMPANEVAQGRVVEGIGGGICQVATALHDVALNAGFRVDEHHPHSRRPSYAALGVDTAVAWGQKDLRFENTLPFHVRVRAVATGGELTVELWGSDAGPSVQIATEVDRQDDGSLHVERTRVIGRGDRRRSERVTMRYPPRRG